MTKSMKYLIYRYFSDNLGKGLSLFISHTLNEGVSVDIGTRTGTILLKVSISMWKS